MYKDPDKQREANRVIQAKRRSKGVTQGVTESGCDGQGVTRPKFHLVNKVDPVNGDVRLVQERIEPEHTAQGNITDSYKDIVLEVVAPIIEVKPERTAKGNEDREDRPKSSQAKRGKDIKCFEDLPADVQETIHRLSTIDGRIDPTSKANRTAIAVHYQHLFPDRYYSAGVT